MQKDFDLLNTTKTKRAHFSRPFREVGAYRQHCESAPPIEPNRREPLLFERAHSPGESAFPPSRLWLARFQILISSK